MRTGFKPVFHLKALIHTTYYGTKKAAGGRLSSFLMLISQIAHFFMILKHHISILNRCITKNDVL